jgi:thiol:disulfide interchange protein
MQNDSNLRLNKFYLITFFILFFFKAQSQEINWISLEEVVEFQKTEPKNVIIDVYTNWCGPCKLMDKNTFSNPEIASYIKIGRAHV